MIRVWRGNAFRSRADLRARRTNLLETEYCSPVQDTKNSTVSECFIGDQTLTTTKNSIRLQMAPEMMATNEDSEYEAREFQSQRPTHQSRTSGSWILELRNGRNSFHYRQMVLVAGTGSGLKLSRSMLPTTKGQGTM